MRRAIWLFEKDEMSFCEKIWVQAFDLDCNADQQVKNKV